MAENGRQKGEIAFVLALASGKTVRDAATAAGISERQAYRRLKSSECRQQVTETRTQMFERVAGVLAAAMGAAVECLLELLKADSETVRLGASRSIIDLGFRAREAMDVEERLQCVEQILCSKPD